MIQKENIEFNGKLFVRTFSDKGFYIIRQGIYYKEAYDPLMISRVYEESDKLILDKIN